MTNDVVPEGFGEVPRGLGYTDTLQPFYRRVEGDKASFGLLVAPQHGNSMGICHGGVLMTLADITAAAGVNLARDKRAGSPTINLSVDFISSAGQGSWIQANVEQVSVKRRFGFCSGAIYKAEGIVARFNGTFYFPDHKGMWKNGVPTEGALADLYAGD
jgi:uncharacterized protein (TIGR00369 family)